MHYEVDKHLIRSENVARSIKQASNYLVSWILSYGKIDNALDYGCGKLRYVDPLTKISDSLTIVDSEIQIKKKQTINGIATTIQEYVDSRWSNINIFSVKDFKSRNEKYSFILCANVLSAIPLANIRSNVLFSLSSCLGTGGNCLFVSQYTNSFYSKLKNDPKAKPHLDGYIVTKRGRSSYFGILNKSMIEKLALAHGFRHVESWTNGQSAYVLARKSA